MLGISVELGTYSIKFLNYQVDKKSIRFLNTDEIVMDSHISHSESTDHYDLWDEQLKLIRNYLDDIKNDYQLLLNLPSEMVSTRIFALPVKSRKKASLMLPFQIEEDLPYSLTNAHWAETMTVEGNKVEATVGVIRREHFQEFFNHLKSNNINPNILTSDVSIYDGFMRTNTAQFSHSFSIINIGHETTSGFYFHKGKLISNHNSYVAGAALTEAISHTYTISYDEATIYKHQNSFLLLEEQYDKVNENQRGFAKVMDTTLAPLISEIRRWDIGFRVSHGEAIKEIYICGGTSNIKNIQNYLSAKLNVVVHFFDPYTSVNADKIDPDDRLRRKFSQVATLSSNASKRSKLINFLRGDFTLSSSNDLPLESMSFIGLRLSLLAFVLCVSMLIETLLLTSHVGDAKRVATGLYKNIHLKESISKSIIRRAKKNPTIIIRKLEQKEKMVQQEVKVIQSSLEINALSSLLGILRKVSGFNAEIIKFVNKADTNIDLILSTSNLEDLISLQQVFQTDTNHKWLVQINKKSLTLSIGGTGK